MEIIVENGTMPEGANSFVSLADCEGYCVDRGLWEADGDEDAKTRAILRAAEILSALKWKGVAWDWLRLLPFPRKGLKAPDGSDISAGVVPPQVKRSQCELAALLFAGEDPLAKIEHDGSIASESHASTEKVDVIQTSTTDSVTYAKDAPSEAYYPSVYGPIEWLLEVVPGKHSRLSCVRISR